MSKKKPPGEQIRFSSGVVHPLISQLPFYGRVPKGWEDQLSYRKRTIKRCSASSSVQRRISDACKKDFLFWLNTFVWIFEPRIGEDHEGLIPFNSWPHQDPVAAALDYYFGSRHIIGDKSRAQGASWLEVSNLVHKFLYRYCYLGMGSKDKESADTTDNPESLGFKFDFVLAHLPEWMKPPDIAPGESNRKISDSTWHNVENGSYCKAYSATKGIGRGGRFTSFFLDESAFFLPGLDTQAVSNLIKTTNGLVMLSTPNGLNNEHYERIHNQRTWVRVILDWHDNCQQNQGLYTAKSGRWKRLDEGYEYPPDFKPVLDGRVRSPWYDKRCLDDNNNMLLIGQEYDRVYTGSKGRPFSEDDLNRALLLCKEPIHTGMLFYEQFQPREDLSWVEGEAYQFHLWLPLHEGRMPEGNYVIGADISAGVGGDGGSNSVLSIFDQDTNQQVAEFSSNSIPPEEFADFAMATCWWLGTGASGAHLCWEKNGPGVRFTKRVVELQYPNIYYQRSTDRDLAIGRSKVTTKPGYHNHNTSIALSALTTAMYQGDITFRSSSLIDECRQYIIDGEKVYHPKSRVNRDSSALGSNHGDRAIAASMALHAINTRKRIRRGNERPSQETEVYSMLWRMEQHEKNRKEALSNLCRF